MPVRSLEVDGHKRRKREDLGRRHPAGSLARLGARIRNIRRHSGAASHRHGSRTLLRSLCHFLKFHEAFPLGVVLTRVFTTLLRKHFTGFRKALA